MFNKLKQLFGANPPPESVRAAEPLDAASRTLGSTAFGDVDANAMASRSDGTVGAALDMGALAQWCEASGVRLSARERGGIKLDGRVKGHAWRMELGRPSRDFIHGEELRARAELGLDENAVVLLMSRELKEQLEKRAFSLYTDPLQTTVDPNLPEEMRWLAMFEEFGWDDIGKPFFERFAVLSDSRERAMSWLTPELAQDFMAMPGAEAAGCDVPVVFMVLRGKAYLRVQHSPPSQETLQRAHTVFVHGCEAAIAGLSTDLAI